MFARGVALCAVGISHAATDENLVLLQTKASVELEYDKNDDGADNNAASVCADSEGQICHCTGTVYYGRKFVQGKPGNGATTTLSQLKSTGFVSKSVSGWISCSNDALTDPYSGFYKYCLCESKNDASPIKSRHDHSDKCLDYNYNNQNVFMHTCHTGTNQQWYMDSERMKTNYNNKCLDMDYNNNVYMHACHNGANQQWYFDGEYLKTRHDTNKCFDYNYNNGNIYMHACHNGGNQKFYYTHPKSAAYASKVKSQYSSKCMDVNGDGNIYFNVCNDQASQKFYLSGWELKSFGSAKCVDYHFGHNDNVAMYKCHGGSNQQWHFDGTQLKSNYNNKCFDLHPHNDNIHMHNCHGGANQKFYLENVVQGLEHDEVADEIQEEEAEEKVCKNWCHGKKHADKPWQGVKCAWKSCAGCDECS